MPDYVCVPAPSARGSAVARRVCRILLGQGPANLKVACRSRRRCPDRWLGGCMRLCLGGALMVLGFLLACAPATAACVDPAALVHSTVSITRHFDEQEQKAEPGVLGIRGTAWFLSPTKLATAGHVVAAMKLSDAAWREIELLEGESKHAIAVRVMHVAGAHSETIAVLELQRAVPGGQSLKIRAEPLVPEEPLISLAYPNNRLRFAGGRFVEYGNGDKFAGTALLELYDGEDRLVLDHGASGAPVLDCQGRVVALVSNVFTQTLQFFSRPLRISTAWGSPNVVSVPIDVLKDAAKAE